LETDILNIRRYEITAHAENEESTDDENEPGKEWLI